MKSITNTEKKEGRNCINEKKKKKGLLIIKKSITNSAKKRKSKYSMKIVDLRWGKATIPSNTICLRTERNTY